MLHRCDRRKYSLFFFFTPLQNKLTLPSAYVQRQEHKVLPIKDEACFSINCTERKQKKNLIECPFYEFHHKIHSRFSCFLLQR